MGKVEYKISVYLLEEDDEKKYMYLIDEDMKIETIGKVSVNLLEKALSIAVNTTSYRKISYNSLFHDFIFKLLNLKYYTMFEWNFFVTMCKIIRSMAPPA